MKANDLEVLIEGLETKSEHFDNTLDELKRNMEKLTDQVFALKSQADKCQQKLDDHIAQVEKWDARRWATIGLFIGAVLSLVANLVLAVVNRK